MSIKNRLEIETPEVDAILKENEGFVKAKFSVSRPSGSGTPYISVEIIDDTSGVHVLDLRIPYAEFAQGLTGLGRRPCGMKIGHPEHIGKIHQTKEEVVEYIGEHPYKEREPKKYATWAAKVLKAYEVDGWYARDSDLTNSHRIIEHGRGNKPTRVNVTFNRLVTPAQIENEGFVAEKKQNGDVRG